MNNALLSDAIAEASNKLIYVRMDHDALLEKAAVATITAKLQLARLRHNISGIDDAQSTRLRVMFDDMTCRLEALEQAVVDHSARENIDQAADALNAAMHEVNKPVVLPKQAEEHSLSDPSIRQQVLALTGGKCAYCAVELKDGGGEADQFCIEHVVPASKGGPNHLSNYVPSCRSCNNSKGDRHVLYFIQNSFVLRQRVTP